jgi:hypothetical protein
MISASGGKSVRYYYYKKATVEESCDLTVFQLKERGMLKGGYTSTVITWVRRNTGKESRIGLEVNMTDEPYARLTYLISDREGNSTPYDLEVSLVTTSCNYGGVRYWFVCPTCSRRVGGLYLAPGEHYFMCRQCNNLTYDSRNRCPIESGGHISRQIDKLRSEIKRWTWRGRPTRKVRRLHTLERKAGVLGKYYMRQLERITTRMSK